MSDNSILECLCCGSANLQITLDLQRQPPANLYTKNPAPNIPQFPLCLNRCMDCWHSQLNWNVNREDIFDEYAYVSSTSQTLKNFFIWFANALKEFLPDNARVLEIAANDGSLISELQMKGLNCIGIDPAKNIVEQAKKKKLPVELGYWPQDEEKIKGKFDAIVCMNVLAHVDTPLLFLKACTDKLAPGGTIIIQPSQARMFENGEFDTIYHEHISFFNSRSIRKLAERVGLKLTGTALVKVHGDSPIYFLQHASENPATTKFLSFSKGDFSIPENLIKYEERIGLFDEKIYKNFKIKATNVISNVKSVVSEYKNLGFNIVFVGAAAKAITVLNAAGLKPDHLLDESPLKIGLYAPGCNTLVEPLTEAAKWSQQSLFIISAWNFRKELTQKLKKQGAPANSKFYAYFPSPHWIDE